jgi:hypothetical protein
MPRGAFDRFVRVWGAGSSSSGSSVMGPDWRPDCPGRLGAGLTGAGAVGDPSCAGPANGLVPELGDAAPGATGLDAGGTPGLAAAAAPPVGAVTPGITSIGRTGGPAGGWAGLAPRGFWVALAWPARARGATEDGEVGEACGLAAGGCDCDLLALGGSWSETGGSRGGGSWAFATEVTRRSIPKPATNIRRNIGRFLA